MHKITVSIEGPVVVELEHSIQEAMGYIGFMPDPNNFRQYFKRSTGAAPLTAMNFVLDKKKIAENLKGVEEDKNGNGKHKKK